MGSGVPTFGTVRPSVPNTRADCSPYGQSVFADAVDAIQSVGLAFDAFINKVDAGLMDRAEYRAKWYGESRK